MQETTEIKTMESLVNRMLEVSADSPVYRKIAAYVEKEYMRLIFMTAEELAGELSISQGSVSKFCITLGYKGYADFLRNLQRLVGKKITAPERFYYTSQNEHHIDDVIEKEIANLHLLKAITDSQEYTALVDALASYREVYLLSARMSATLLPYMKYLFDKLRDRVYMVTPDMGEWEYLQLKKEKEEIFVVGLGLPRYPRVLVDKLKVLREEGFSIGIITDSRFSPLCKYGNINIFLPTTVSSIFDLYSTPMAFLNLLVTDVSKKIPQVKERLDRIERQDIQNKVFYNKK